MNNSAKIGIGIGATLLGAYLFGGGGSSLFGGGASNIGPVASGVDYGAMISGAGPGATSIFSNPMVLSSGIMAGTSLLSGLFGSNAQADATKLDQAALAEKQREADMQNALAEKQLAQQLIIAKMQAGAASAGSGAAARAAGITAAANKSIAKASAIGNAASGKAAALQIPLAARAAQANAAQTTGVQSGAFFNNLMQNLQAPAMRAAQ